MKKGFTLIELVIVFGIIVAVGAVAFANLSTRKSVTDLTATSQQIASLLRQAQIDAIQQKSNTSWGVHFENSTTTTPFYALFQTSYSTATIVGGLYRLPPTVAYTTSTLASGATLNMTFSAITGTASASASIGLYMPQQNSAFSSTISIASSGSVTY